MSLRDLPEIKAFNIPVVTAFDISENALDLWDATIAKSGDDSDVISIFGEIGYDGNDSKRISAALRSIGAKDVTLEINSQGGNFFEGVGIYNLLRAHPHKVTVKVMGIAASAASVIAMAGDEVLLAQSGSLMIHNCSAVIIANRLELVDVISNMEKFDAAMAGVYADRSNETLEAITSMMDAETYFTGQEAVDIGLADDFLPSDAIKRISAQEAKPLKAVAKIDNALLRQGCTRSESRALLSDVKGAKQDAGLTVTHDADEITEADISALFKL